VTRPWNGRLLSQAAATPASPRVSGEDRVPVVDKNVSPPARILIASAQTLVRVGVVAALARVPDLEVVGEVQYGKEAGEILELCRTLRPDLVLVDLDNGYRGGLEVVREIRAEHLETVVLALTNQENEELLLRVVGAGIRGYVPMDSSPDQLAAAIRAALRGRSPINRELAMQALTNLLGDAPERPTAPYAESPPFGTSETRGSLLTPREVDVLSHVAVGKSNRKIARELHLSLSTVKTHLEHIFSKLEVNDRAQAVFRAAELNLLPEQTVENRSIELDT
jgi:DNA-binding NarL/FixJ family response regulator